MSIQSEITRISGNVADALTAIAAKGVTVPQGANSDDLADLIGSIASDLTTKTITLNGTYDPDDDNADGYSEVTVNVANGASVTEVQNAYGTELRITSAPGAGPSATQHTITLGLSDDSTVTIPVYYDNALIGTMITAYSPATWTYNGLTVYTAALDNVQWYDETPAPTPSGDWTTLFDGSVAVYNNEAYITDLVDKYFAASETYRVTLDGVQHTGATILYPGTSIYIIGNEELVTDVTATGDPYVAYNDGNGYGMRWILRDAQSGTSHTLKLEQQTSGGS